MKEKFLILLAGPPCTGKTYLLDLLKEHLEEIFVITPDEVKIDFAEKYGFCNKEEKRRLEVEKVWPFYYHILEQYMYAWKKVIVSEYPFSDKQKERIANFSEKYGYHVITIRLQADFDILWQRRYQRDRRPDRHLSLIMTHYHYGDELEDRNLADDHITRQQFHQIIEDRQYNHFQLGELFKVDVTDFSKVDYAPLLRHLCTHIFTKNK
ncbi:AAA family ATPase [Allofustis seminis]|uniref:AAA family ATPase n=1 Tax=Allofustis seminis TaxID=166939 RepID=UPI00035C501E|nr:AAA family ATPase [Allofustis seminis]